MDAIRLGRGIRVLRQRRGWRQEDLASAAGVSRSVVARVEQGLGDRLPVVTLARIAGALGARLVARLDWQGEQLDRLIDARHAAVVDVVVAELTRHGWLCVTEATFNVYGERGSVDVLAYHQATGVVLVVEVKSVLPELGGMLATLDRKVRHARRFAADRGWRPVAVARLLVIGDESLARRRLTEHRAVFDAAFPVRGWAARRWLANPDPRHGWSGLWIPSGDRHMVVTRRQRVRPVRVERGTPSANPPRDRQLVTRGERPA
ncbi:MAG TPA: helix-turn-helix transcriptional regulator [Candidatus Limnocylindrales bacterium]|jgi:transcriptional regulator with XRE-family HTH domain